VGLAVKVGIVPAQNVAPGFEVIVTVGVIAAVNDRFPKFVCGTVVSIPLNPVALLANINPAAAALLVA
jgi:hypothetical protein